MTFLNPTIAAVGLACVALPILIHILLRRRRKPIEFGAMRFLLEAYRQQRRRLQFEQFLLLATRCLLVALIALALGKPLLGAAGLLGDSPARSVYVLIDNSLTSSVQTTLAGEKALERHRREAARVLASLDSTRGDRAGVIALASPADALVLPATSDLASASAAIRSLRPADSKADLSAALARVAQSVAQDAEEGSRESLVVVLSDFRVGSADLDHALPSVSARLLATPPTTDPASNVAITAVEPLQSIVLSSGDSGPIHVRVELRRSGIALGEAAATKVRLLAAPPTQLTGTWSEKTIRWQPGEETASAVLTAQPPPDAPSRKDGIVLRATIDADALESDNTFDRPLEARSQLSAAIVTSTPLSKGAIQDFTPADWLSLALSPSNQGTLRTRRAGDVTITILDPGRDLSQAGAAATLAGIDAIFVPEPQSLDALAWRRLRVAADQGCLVVVSTPPGVTVHTWTDAFLEAFALDWSIAREAREHAPEPARAAPGASASTPGGLLATIAAELEELTKAVRVTRSLPVEANSSGAFESHLALADATPLVVAATPGSDAKAPRASRGLVVFVACALDLSWTDLPARPLMVPMVQELLRQGVGRALGTKTTLAGQSWTAPAGASDLALVASRAEAAEDLIPLDASGSPGQPLRSAGLWRLRAAAAGSPLGILAVNPDPAGGRVELLGEQEVQTWLGGAGTLRWLRPDELSSSGPGGTGVARALEAAREKPPISVPLMLAAACLALVELALARLFSHASLPDQPQGAAA